MKKMKLMVLGLMLGAALVVNGAMAQAGCGGGCCKAKSEKHMKKMAKKFGLTAEQQTQIQKLMDEKSDKMMEVQKSYGDQVRNILNDEQKAKWDKKMEKYKKCEMK